MITQAGAPCADNWDWVTVEALAEDPYPIYAALRRAAPAMWLPSLGMWFVTDYAHIQAVLLDNVGFITADAHSTIFDTFGEQMLTASADRHRLYRDTRLQKAFMPKAIAPAFGPMIAARVASLFAAIGADGTPDFRRAFAARLPVLVMLDTFGLPDTDEVLFRGWFDTFEAALANHVGDPAVRVAARASADAFHRYFQPRIDAVRAHPDGSVLDAMIARAAAAGLGDDAVRRNALIVLFGGISTVEALILNCLWSLLHHPDVLAQVRRAPDLLPAVVDETMRWMAPVQSATRHTAAEVMVGDVRIPAGATVNCMIAAANRDPAVFDDPDSFRLGRPNAARHLGFAMGQHHCLGQHLARAEAVAAIGHVLRHTDTLTLAEPVVPVGHEFRQPRRLPLRWTPR